MMAARGNAAKKAMDKKANQDKRKSSVVDDTISEEDIKKFKAAEREREKNKVVDTWRDPQCASNPISRAWMTLSQKINLIAYGEKFGAGILFCIIIAGVLVGMQTYEGMEDDPIVTMVDNIILGVFTFECFLKIFAEGWAIWSFWTGPEWKWNNFDFIVVALCMPFAKSLTGGNVAVLRLMRLARLVKLVKKVPQLQMIIMGLAGGIKSIGYILLLLFLVFYLYAILGMFMFKENDPWHFGNLQITLLTLFRAATMEDWTDIMYIG